MITKITCRYSFEVLDFHCNDFGFTFNIGISYLGIYKTSMVPATLTTDLLVWIHQGSGMNALPRKGSSCHNVNCNDWKLENTHHDPFNSNTSMKFNNCRLTSSTGGAVSVAYTTSFPEVRDWWLCDNARIHRLVTHNRDGNLEHVCVVFDVGGLH